MAWDDIEIYQIGALARPLLLAKGSKGVLACGYLNAETFTKTGEACAIVVGVNTFDDMLNAAVVSASDRAIELGITIGSSGREALERLR